MENYKIDLPVLIIFFARPNTLEKVFAEVKKARPSKLFLACDGPRENRPGELEEIEKCKKIVEDIDWDCEIYKNYSEVNQGCGRGPANAISWAFTYVDKLLILEDDCVPDQSLFPYMKELLDKYENDNRIGIVSGFNHFKEWDAGENSYFFAKAAATLGWGTWKRVWDNFDYHVEGITSEYYSKLLEKELCFKRAGKARIETWKKANIDTKTKKVNYWDYQFGFIKYSQSLLCIVPKGNLIYNIGIGSGSTHTENTKFQKWKLGKILFMPTVEMQFPLIHPKYIICDRKYDETYFKKMAYPSKIKRLYRLIKRRIFKK